MPPFTMDRTQHQPLLLWMMNSYPVAKHLIKNSTTKLNPSHEVLVIDVRTKRGTSVASLDHETVFTHAKIAELTALRQTLSSHPYMYNARWCKAMSLAVKENVKMQKGKAGVFIIFAYGDAPEHAPDQDDAVPDFNMNIALYNENDLEMIAKANNVSGAVPRTNEQLAQLQQLQNKQQQLLQAAGEASAGDV